MTDDRDDELDRILRDPAAEDADVARFLQVARQRLSEAPDEITRARHLTAIHAAGRRTAGRAGMGWWARVRTVLGLTGAKVALAGAVAVAAVGGAGATGSLPDPVQDRTADVADVFGLDFPRPGTDDADEPGAGDAGDPDERPAGPPEASTAPELPDEADLEADDRRRDDEAGEDPGEQGESDEVRRDDEARDLSEDADEQDGAETSEEARDLRDDGPEQAPEDAGTDSPQAQETATDGRDDGAAETTGGDEDGSGDDAEEGPGSGSDGVDDVPDGDGSTGSTPEDPAGTAAGAGEDRSVDASDRSRR